MDVSISRHHCTFTMDKEGIILNDTNSKYGSLIKVEKPICILPKAIAFIQVGNNLIKCFLKDFSTPFCLCWYQ